MAWQDLMNEMERTEYDAAHEIKVEGDTAFRAVSKKMKIRCDARKRRMTYAVNVPETGSNKKLEAYQDRCFNRNDTSNKKGADE